jgi:hypothetical protein
MPFISLSVHMLRLDLSNFTKSKDVSILDNTFNPSTKEPIKTVRIV